MASKNGSLHEPQQSWGWVCDTEVLVDIARCYNLKLLFDAAHSLGVSYKGNMVGTFGEATMLSFHATKYVNAFEGGAVVTNSDEIAARLRATIDFGFNGIDRVECICMNAKMSEASAAMGLTSLDSMDEFIAVNRRNYQRYLDRLGGIAGVEVIRYPDQETSNYQYISARIDESLSGIGRDDIVRVLWQENVLLRRYFYPGCHRMQPYRSLYSDAGESLPETQKIAREVICFPTGQSITLEDVDRISHLLRLVIENSAEVVAVLSTQPRGNVA